MTVECTARDCPSGDELDAAVRRRRGPVAVRLYEHHPSERFGHAFNTAAVGVGSRWIEPMVLSFRRTLARFVDDGDIRDGDHLHAVAVPVLRTCGFHYRCLTWNHENPSAVQPGAVDGEGAPVRAPLFVADAQAAYHAITNASPSDRLRHAELVGVIGDIAREVGLQHFRVVNLVHRYAFEHGKFHGAFVHAARFAITADGSSPTFRPRRTPVTKDRPDEKLIRRTRRFYLISLERIAAACRRRGISPRTGSDRGLES